MMIIVVLCSVFFSGSVIPCFAACSFQAFGYFNTIACTPTSKSSCTWLLRVKGRSKEETGILRQVLTRTRLPIMNFLSLCVHCRDGSSAIPTVLSATSDLVLKLNIVVFTKTVIYCCSFKYLAYRLPFYVLFFCIIYLFVHTCDWCLGNILYTGHLSTFNLQDIRWYKYSIA